MDTISTEAAIELRVPDIGDFSDIPVIELLVKPGDLVKSEDSVATLESDKATLDVPANVAGRVLKLEVTRGSRVSKGTLLMTLEPVRSTETDEEPVTAPPTESPSASVKPSAPLKSRSDFEPNSVVGNKLPKAPVSPMRIYASPSVRRIGRDLGVDLSGVKGSGRGGRITAEDVRQFVRESMSRRESPAQLPSVANALQASTVDFAKYGETAREPLSRIRRISAAILARNWATIPHVTNFDSADITDLEQFRKSLFKESDGLKVTLLSFLVKASAATLRAMPAFNASLDGEQVVLKKYVHIGVAVDTNDGLLVPVLRNADQLGVLAIASALAQKATLARNGKLKATDMEGGCFTISSLGGIGGSGFTPIINAPELAILGVGKARLEPRWDGNQFLPRLIVPLCLSWDHRALDGVAAARFLVMLVHYLEDFRRVLL